jgi:hypothetical protein
MTNCCIAPLLKSAVEYSLLVEPVKVLVTVSGELPLADEKAVHPPETPVV